VRRLARIDLAAALVPSALALWGFVVEPASLRLREYELAPPGWPRACDGLRVAALADLHVGSPWNGLGKLAEIVAETRAAHPDLVLLAGDYVIHGVRGGERVPPEAIGNALRGLDPPLGTWAVLGNHDWWLGQARVRHALEAAGVRVLEDESAPIDGGGCAFWLTGIGDFWESPHDVGAALRPVPEGAPILALTHNPDVFPLLPPARASLTIAGHTHGGQVYVPLYGRPVVPSNYGARYAIGHVVEGGRHLFVTPGLGTSVIPVRFLVPPEISLLTLRADTLREVSE
jgi:predicted MPP superfamily phosphohydrolase